MYNIDSQIQIGAKFNLHPDGKYPDEVIKNEPMFFNSSAEYAFNNGGQITKDFIAIFINQALVNGEDPDKLQDLVFDSRVHMLMKGWFPCIPGFHHDDVPRNTTNGQPDYDTPTYRSNHCLGLVNGEICPTEYAIGNIDLPAVGSDNIIYKVWHPLVEEAILEGKMTSVSAPSDRLVYFNDRSFHQGVRALKSGWRWFGRLSWNTERTKTCTNEIRRQVQVYLEHPMEGW